MNISSLLSGTINPLHVGDDFGIAIAMMQDFGVRHLPLIDDKGLFIGIIAEDVLLDSDDQISLEKLILPFENLTCSHRAHLFDFIHFFKEKKLSIVPIVNDENIYQGCIGYEDIVMYIAEKDFIKDQGGLIELETSIFNFSLMEISKIVESEGARIMHSDVQTIDAENLLITLKINSNNLSGIIAAFERYQYTVIQSYRDKEEEDSLKDRYDLLMKYLSI